LDRGREGRGGGRDLHSARENVLFSGHDLAKTHRFVVVSWPLHAKMHFLVDENYILHADAPLSGRGQNSALSSVLGTLRGVLGTLDGGVVHSRTRARSCS